MSADALANAGRHLRGFALELPQEQRAALGRLLQLSVPAPTPLTELGAQPPESVLSANEVRLFRRLAEEELPQESGLRPTIVMIMKGTRLCNLRCTYCNQWDEGPNQTMRFPVLARAIRDVLRAPGVRNVQFVWHGGETTLLPIEFYRKALWLQQQFRRPGQVIRNGIQTNGTRLSDEWLDFLYRYELSVGVSLDGPAEIHDQRRLDVAGRATFSKVRAGLASLQQAQIPHGVLLVVDDRVVDFGAQRLLDSLLELGITSVDFLNALPKNTAVGAPAQGLYLSWQRYISFLREVFQCWWPELTGRLAIRELDGLLARVSGGPPGTCVFAGDCFGGFLTIDPGGDVSACDKYVDDPDYLFGNILTKNLSVIAAAGRLKSIRESNSVQLAAMRECPWFDVCQGGCPHDRYTSLRRGSDGKDPCCGFAPLLSDIKEVVTP
jgi:uncharacterized protein